MAKPFKMEDIESEESFVDCAQHNVVLVDSLAKELKGYILKAKVTKPFGSLKKWMKDYVGTFDWNTQSYDILLQWVVSLSLFVEGFAPPAFAQNEFSLLVPDLITNVLLPQVNQDGAQHAPTVQQSVPAANVDNVAELQAEIASLKQQLAGKKKKPSAELPHVSAQGSSDDPALNPLLLTGLEHGQTGNVVVTKHDGIASVPAGNVVVHANAICPHCRNKLPQNLPFCTFCGGRQQVACVNPQCKLPLGQGNSFCGQCGTQAGAANVHAQHQPSSTQPAHRQPGLFMSSQVPMEMALGTAASAHVVAKPVGARLVAAGSEEKPKPQFPSFMYDESKKRLVDLAQPLKSDQQPDGWSPNPALQHWKVPSSMNDYEKRRVWAHQEVLGYMHVAASMRQVCSYPANGVNAFTPFSELDPFQRAMFHAEYPIKFALLTRQEGLTPEEARQQLGFDASPLSKEEKKDMVKEVTQQRKLKERLQAAKPQRPAPQSSMPSHTGARPEEPPDKGDRKKKGKCYACGQKGHMSFQCPNKAQGGTNPFQDANVFVERMQQMQTAASPAQQRPGGH